MSKRTLIDRVKDFDSLIKTVADQVPMPAVRKLYKLTKDLAKRLETVDVEVEPNDLVMVSHNQEIDKLKKEIQELRSDKWYTPLWNKE